MSQMVCDKSRGSNVFSQSLSTNDLSKTLVYTFRKYLMKQKSSKLYIHYIESDFKGLHSGNPLYYIL